MVQIPFQLLSIQFRCRVIISHLERHRRGLRVMAAITNRSVPGSSPAGEPWLLSCLYFFLPLFHRHSFRSQQPARLRLQYVRALKNNTWHTYILRWYIGTSVRRQHQFPLAVMCVNSLCKWHEEGFPCDKTERTYLKYDLFLNLTKLWRFKTLRTVQKS